MMELKDIILEARRNQCSDLHITCGTAIAVRRFGVLQILEDIKPTIEEAEEMIFSFLHEKDIEMLRAGLDVDVATTDVTGGRCRINVYHQRNNLAASIRLLESRIPTFQELEMEGVLTNFANAHSGLVLVTGPTGSGKSTTLASVIDYINQNQARHVITIEDPIEYVYYHDKAMIHQRQVGKDVKDFATALRSSLREDPDVIMVGEMRDFETINAAITAAETGHLVLSTMHTKSAAQTIDRIISACPIDVQNNVVQQFASILLGVIVQSLIPTADANGRVAATEIMINTPAISNLIREHKINQIPSSIQAGGNLGMHTMNASLRDLVRSGRITRKEAFIHSQNITELESMI